MAKKPAKLTWFEVGGCGPGPHLSQRKAKHLVDVRYSVRNDSGRGSSYYPANPLHFTVQVLKPNTVAKFEPKLSLTLVGSDDTAEKAKEFAELFNSILQEDTRTWAQKDSISATKAYIDNNWLKAIEHFVSQGWTLEVFSPIPRVSPFAGYTPALVEPTEVMS